MSVCVWSLRGKRCLCMGPPRAPLSPYCRATLSNPLLLSPFINPSFGALAGNRTRVNCLEGSYAHHYTTNAAPPGRRPHDAATPLTPDSAQRSLRRRPPLTALRAQGDRPNHSHTHGSAAPRSPSPAHARLAHSRSHSHAHAGVPGRSRLLAAATRRASPGRRPRDPLRAGHHPDPPGTPVAQAQRGARRAFPHTWSPTRSGLAWDGAVGAAGKRVRWRHVAGPAASKRV